MFNSNEISLFAIVVCQNTISRGGYGSSENLSRHCIFDIAVALIVAFLVSVVTKQKKEKYEKSKQVDSYRQILASVEYDVRAVLIKLADRFYASLAPFSAWLPP